MATLLKYKKGLKRPTLAWNECHSLQSAVPLVPGRSRPVVRMAPAFAVGLTELGNAVLGRFRCCLVKERRWEIRWWSLTEGAETSVYAELLKLWRRCETRWWPLVEGAETSCSEELPKSWRGWETRWWSLTEEAETSCSAELLKLWRRYSR